MSDTAVDEKVIHHFGSVEHAFEHLRQEQARHRHIELPDDGDRKVQPVLSDAELYDAAARLFEAQQKK